MSDQPRERRLGRGLEALLGRVDSSQPNEGGEMDAIPVNSDQPPRQNLDPQNGILWLSIDAIDNNPFQPRKDFDPASIAKLQQSIAQHGILQPLLVRRAGDRYQLISGERRLRAASASYWDQVPVQVWEADDRKMAEVAIVENVQRKDLGPLEKAASFQRYLQDYGCTQEELAGRVSIDRSTIANLIRLLELPEPVQQALRDGAITQGHARALLPLGDEREQCEFCQRIQNEHLSVRATEQAVQDQIHQADAEPFSVVGDDDAPAAKKSPKPRSEHLAYLEQELRTALGTKVEIKASASGRGRITIHFANNDEFERLRGQLSAAGLAPPREQAG